MKTIRTKHIIIDYVVPESINEDQEIKRIIREVKEEAFEEDLSQYEIRLPISKK